MRKVRAPSPARRGAFSTIIGAALAFALAAVPIASGASQENPLLVHDQLTITDVISGDEDNVVEPGEGFTLSERIRNVGSFSVNTISSYLYSHTGFASVSVPSSTYPDLTPGATGTNVSPFTAGFSDQVPCGTSVPLSLSVSSAQGNVSIPVPIRVGALGTPTARNSTNVPIEIASPGLVESTLEVTEAGLIGDVNVRISELRHTYDEDLRISLIAPDQTRVVLAEYVGGSGDDYLNTVFDDDAPTSIFEASPPFTGTFRPQEPLALFGGRQAQGVWKLQIQDVYSEDGGTLRAWGDDASLALCNRSPDASFSYSPDEPKAKAKVTFASDSSDPDGSIASQAWDLDDDGVYDDGTDTTATRTYGQRGTYVVHLRVVDNGGEAAVVTDEIIVGPARKTRAARCLVPNVRGKTLRAARRTLRRAHCSVGRVRYARSARGRGRVISQSPRPAVRRPLGAKVNLVVSKGRR
jgi:subtilisin-like proprotein convertase family protein